MIEIERNWKLYLIVITACLGLEDLLICPSADLVITKFAISNPSVELTGAQRSEWLIYLVWLWHRFCWDGFKLHFQFASLVCVTGLSLVESEWGTEEVVNFWHGNGWDITLTCARAPVVMRLWATLIWRRRFLYYSSNAHDTWPYIPN